MNEQLAGAIAQLRNHQRQLDQDGVFVGVSRQALEEVLASITQPVTQTTGGAAAKSLAIRASWESCPVCTNHCTVNECKNGCSIGAVI